MSRMKAPTKCTMDIRAPTYIQQQDGYRIRLTKQRNQVTSSYSTEFRYTTANQSSNNYSNLSASLLCLDPYQPTQVISTIGGRAVSQTPQTQTQASQAKLRHLHSYLMQLSSIPDPPPSHPGKQSESISHTHPSTN